MGLRGSPERLGPSTPLLALVSYFLDGVLTAGHGMLHPDGSGMKHGTRDPRTPGHARESLGIPISCQPSPQVTEAIFAPFERGGRDAADAVPGVGLGLALSRGLARDLGGDLLLEPGVPGGGACFKLLIPLRR